SGWGRLGAGEGGRGRGRAGARKPHPAVPATAICRAALWPAAASVVAAALVASPVGRRLIADSLERLDLSHVPRLGTGLSISRSLILSHRGRLWAPPTLGDGAIFQFV